MNEEVMKKAIKEKKIVEISVNTLEKGMITRKCIPFDIGTSNKYKDGVVRYHFLTLDSPDGKHNLSVLLKDINYIKTLDEYFNPEDHINWQPKWKLPRDWGKYS
jgi:hypothetical protein